MAAKKDIGKLGAATLIATIFAACAAPPTRAANIGMASFYGRDHIGRRTASGSRYEAHALTAARPTLPFGTKLLITNLANQKTVVVEVADRGPFRRGRIVDLSYAAAQALDFARAGVAKVQVDPL